MTGQREIPDTVQAKEKVLSSAYTLFAQRGVRGVGVDEIIAAAGVAKATFYRHFPSKDALVLAFLERREEVWTRNYIVAEACKRGSTPEERLLAVFDVFHDWFQRDDFEACSFINVLLEMGPENVLGRASIEYLARIREQIGILAAEAGLRDVDGFTRSWHILMKGSIISATEGDAYAARRGQEMARWLIEKHRAQA
ncbi:TetR/AcrR family transcriptional regulator [Arthrobacter sp. H14]|uniref:TetR/AcrR family transcriptional regulator n=1 Tax=Arthrobacter sp. H14 TaxID=1312959 RepID=UPI000686C703|nr:TetR/AcrR family transcriptional regulator [Arthrobacter sp. H14]